MAARFMDPLEQIRHLQQVHDHYLRAAARHIFDGGRIQPAVIVLERLSPLSTDLDTIKCVPLEADVTIELLAPGNEAALGNVVTAIMSGVGEAADRFREQGACEPWGLMTLLQIPTDATRPSTLNEALVVTLHGPDSTYGLRHPIYNGPRRCELADFNLSVEVDSSRTPDRRGGQMPVH